MKRSWINALMLAVVVEVGFALVVRTAQLRSFVEGDRSVSTIAAVAGLGWLVVLSCAAIGTGRSLLLSQAQALHGKQTLSGVAHTSREWVWEADAQMRLTYSNGRVRDLLGHQPAHLYGRPLTELLAKGQQAAALGLLTTSLTDRTGWEDVELLWRHADGHDVLLQGSAVTITDANGVILGFRGSRRPVTTEVCRQRTLAAAHERLNSVLATSAIDIALQPIVDLANGRLAGVEALARFRDGRSPDAWFGEAIETGQNVDLDRLAFLTALETFSHLPPHVYLSVNATPALLTDRKFHKVLATRDLPLDRLVIEITEHVEIFRYADINAALAPLRERGVRLAIDDTGAGYASFSHVLKLRPDVIKIDRSLVTGVDHDPARRSLITALVLLALDLQADVTAEGIEEAAELETLRALGVHHAQGYLLDRPTTDQAHWLRWWARTWSPKDDQAPWRAGPAGAESAPATL